MVDEPAAPGAGAGSMRCLGCRGGRAFGMTNRVVAIAARSNCWHKIGYAYSDRLGSYPVDKPARAPSCSWLSTPTTGVSTQGLARNRLEHRDALRCRHLRQVAVACPGGCLWCLSTTPSPWLPLCI